MIGFGFGFSSVLAFPLAFGFDSDDGTNCFSLFIGPFFIEILWDAR